LSAIRADGLDRALSHCSIIHAAPTRLRGIVRGLCGRH
jgi:hypothetical protein